MADIRINALPDGDATFTNTATLPYEDPNDESNKTKRVTISELAQSNVEAYSETRTYKVGDVARFLEAENFICVVAVTTPETFDKAKWEPVRANLETSVIVTKLLGPVAIASIQGDGADTITVNFVDSIATFFQINDLVSVAGTGSYDTIPPSAITDVIDLNTIEINITGNTNTNIVNAGTFFNNSAIIVNATKGFIVNNSAANAEQPSVDVVDEAQQRVVFSNFTVEGNFVLMDAAGAVTAIPASTATSNDKTGNLLLGSVGGIVSSSTIFSVRTQPIQIYQPSITEKFNEFAAGGKISPGGLLTLGLGTTLTINISANTTYFPGIGYEVDPNEPDTITNANDTNPIPVGAFVKVIRTGTTQDDFSIDVTGNELDVDNFNENGTTLAAIPSTGPQFQIFRVYAAASGGPISTAIVYYGETLYESIDEARSRLDNDTFVEKFISRPTAFRGFIITKSGLVNYNAGTENVDFVLIAKPEEYSLDRGNPQNRSLGLTQQQLQADIANESTGSIDEGVITLNSETISTIQGDLGPDPDIVTVVLDSAPSWVAGEFVRILGTVNYDEDYEIQSVSSTTVVLIATIPPSTTLETVGTALSLNRIDIAAGDGQILDHSVPNGFFRTQVTWSDELDILLSPTQLNNQTIYILKDTDGVTSFLTLNDSTINSAQIRNDILLGVIYTKVGLTSPDNERIWALQNQRIAISAPRSQLDDFTDFLFRTVTGADTTEADPSVDYSMGRNTGRIMVSGRELRELRSRTLAGDSEKRTSESSDDR